MESNWLSLRGFGGASKPSWESKGAIEGLPCQAGTPGEVAGLVEEDYFEPCIGLVPNG